MKQTRSNVPANSVCLISKHLFHILLVIVSVGFSHGYSSDIQDTNATSTTQDHRRSGYHHSATAANADSHKENQFSASSGFVPIAKPLIQDIYDVSSSERNVNHLAHQQEHNNTVPTNPEHYHQYFSSHSNYEQPKNEDSYGYSHNVEHYYDEGQSRPDSNRNYYKMPINQASDKFMNEKFQPTLNGHDEASSESDPYASKNMANYQMPPKHQRPYSMYNDEQGMFHPDSSVNMLKNIAQSSEYPNGNMNEGQASSSEQDIQNMLNQFANSNVPQNFNMPMKSNENGMGNLPQEFSGAGLNDFGAFNENLQPTPISGINGIAGFQPAPEGGQLPAPPGYKHVGYITIPAGATNLPNMMSQPSNGLPIIRPVPLNSVDLKLNRDKQELKKTQDNKMAESKPMRSFLSRLNPLNMLRKLRQRRERRQTNDGSSSEYLPLSSKYGSSYGYNTMPSSYSMSPYSSGYSSISGLGGMSGVGGMYTGMSNISPLYMPGYGSYSNYGYSSGYPSYGYMAQSSPVSPYSDMKSSSMGTNPNELTASASAMSNAINPSGAMISPQGQSSHMSMPMMMPMSMSGYGAMNGYPGMGSMSMPSMSMPYGYSGHPQMSSPQSSSQSSSNEQSNSQTLPGGINLSDLLKDEEDDEPSKFKKFLGYLNPMNIIRRFRNNTSDERKRYGRYKRDIKFFKINLDKMQKNPFGKIVKRSDEDIKNVQTITDQPVKAIHLSSQNATVSDLNSNVDIMDDFEDIMAHDTMPQVVHGRRKGPRRLKFNLMGSRNFEVIRGGTFQAEDMLPLRSSESNDYERNAASNEGNILGDVEDMFNNDTPEILGFQGFNGFSSLYNTLSATKETPRYTEFAKRSGNTKNNNIRQHQKPFANIEQAAFNQAITDLKAVS